jgi:hypothetical protein
VPDRDNVTSMSDLFTTSLEASVTADPAAVAAPQNTLHP